MWPALNLKAGAATVRLTAFDGKPFQGSMVIQNTLPGLFSATADGKGTAAGTLDVYSSDGTLKSSTALSTWNATTKTTVANPVNLGAATDKAFTTMMCRTAHC